MKTILTYGFLFLSLLSQAQFTIRQTGLSGFVLTSTCTQDATVRVDYQKGGLRKDTLVSVAANKSTSFELQGVAIGSTVRLKAEGACPTTGWISVALPGTLPLVDDSRFVYQRPVWKGMVRVVGIYTAFEKEMTESEFQKVKMQYRRNYFILRQGKPKEVIL